jgi:hypothetical protein
MPLSIARTSRSASATIKPRPFADQRARHCIPKLGNILVRVVENRALRSKPRKRCVDELVLRIGSPCHA